MPDAAIPSRVDYSAEQVTVHFRALLDGLDYKRHMHELGVGSLNLLKRRKAREQLTSLAIALWRLALERSFPEDAEQFFHHYMTHCLCGGTARVELTKSQVFQYLSLMEEKKDTDFSAAGRHMAEALGLSGEDSRTFSLKISLQIRSLYKMIFENLI